MGRTLALNPSISRGITRQDTKPNPNKVRFCFDYLQPDHDRFPITACTRDFFEVLFREILKYGEWTVEHFMDMNNSEHRHCINFMETEERDGFAGIDPAEESVWTEDAWQFALPGDRGEVSGGWRVHGFIAENMFHIVWLDPEHKLCPTGMRG